MYIKIFFLFFCKSLKVGGSDIYLKKGVGKDNKIIRKTLRTLNHTILRLIKWGSMDPLPIQKRQEKPLRAIPSAGW